LEQPRPLPLEQGRPSYGGPLQLTGRAERIEAGWWDGGDVSRAYFVARRRGGERLWIYLDRRSQHWYLQGLFD
jgi:protein ImuB